MPIDFNKLRELLGSIAQTDITELILKSDDFELTVRKGIPTMPKNASIQDSANASLTLVPNPVPPSNLGLPDNGSSETKAPNSNEGKWEEITSPVVGTFYRSPAPDEAAFVEVNDHITTGQIVCIIEAMKVMNEIEAEVSGQVVEILVENGEPVEYGQPLMLVNPKP